MGRRRRRLNGGVGLSATGSRESDGNVATGGDAYRVQVNLDGVTGADDEVEIRDGFPTEWALLERFSDGERDGDGVVSFGTVDPYADDFDGASYTSLIEPPVGVGSTNQYTFGPAEVVAVDGEESAEFAGTQDVLLVGLSTWPDDAVPPDGSLTPS